MNNDDRVAGPDGTLLETPSMEESVESTVATQDIFAHPNTVDPETTSGDAAASGGTAAESSPGPAAEITAAPAASLAYDELLSEFGQLKRVFEEKIRYDASREAIIDRLHAELQEYKADLLMKMIKPLALGMIRMHDDLGQMLETHSVEDGLPESTQKLLKLLVNLRDDIEDLLSVNGVQSFSVDDPPEFDPKQQRALNRVATSDPALDRHVAQRLRKGFLYNDRVIRPEIVAVYVRE